MESKQIKTYDFVESFERTKRMSPCHVMSWVEFKAFNQIRTVLVSFEGFGIYLDYGIRGNGIRINIIKAKSMAEIHR